MSIFDRWDEAEKRRDNFASQARHAAPGLSAEQVVPGALVTLSSCKVTGDRSYARDIYEVIASNAGHVLLKPTGLIEKPYSADPISIQLHERSFYPAEHLAEALRASTPSQPTEVER